MSLQSISSNSIQLSASASSNTEIHPDVNQTRSFVNELTEDISRLARTLIHEKGCRDNTLTVTSHFT